MKSPLFYEPPKEKGPRSKSIFEMVVPKRDAEGNVIEPEDEEAEEENLTLKQRILRNRWFRILILAIIAALIMFIGNKFFGIGNSKGMRLTDENAARMVVFPNCTYELLESDVSAYDGVIGAVAAYNGSGELEGYAYDLYCTGEGGRILFTLGITKDGTISGLSVTSHKETHGLGTSAGNLFISSFAGLAADETAIDTVQYMDSTPDTSAAIIQTVKNAVRHAHDTYGITGKADEELHESVTEDIAENNTYDTEELRELLPGAVFSAYYPAKGYPLKGFPQVTTAYFATLDGADYYALDMQIAGVDGQITMSVALTADLKIASVKVYDQSESCFKDTSVLDKLLSDMTGCDSLTLNDVVVSDDAMSSSYAVINAAIDAIDCAKEYLVK